MRRKNAITAAIAHLGGRGTGTKRLASLLNLTTARVYQLVTAGVVPHAEQALTLSKETGIPFEDFLIPKTKRKPSGGPNGRGGRKNPKVRAPLEVLTSVSSPAGASNVVDLDVARSPHQRIQLGGRPGQVVRPEKPSSSWTRSAREPIAA